MFDFDAVIFSFEALCISFDTSTYGRTFEGLPCLSSTGTRELLNTVERRALEIKEMISLGRPIIFLMSSPQQCYIQSGEKRYSGTGKNRQTTNIVTSYSPLKDLLPERLELAEAKGKEIELRGHDSLASVWNQLKKYSSYKSYFKTAPGEKMLFIKGTSKAVGSVWTADKSKVVFLPDFDDALQGKATDRRAISETLVELSKSLVTHHNEEMPEWTKRYKLPGEQELELKLKTIEQEIENLQNEKIVAQGNLERLRLLKRLIASQGNALEEQVAESLKELGATVVPGDSGRTDLQVTFEEKVAVVEVKGLKKSGAEKNAAQLEKWVSDHHVKTDKNPKGILVINAFWSTDLQKRTEAAFPHQMLAFSESRHHCLITAGQLMTLVIEGRKAPETRSALLRRIFDTTGIFQGADPLSALDILASERQEAAKKSGLDKPATKKKSTKVKSTKIR